MTSLSTRPHDVPRRCSFLEDELTVQLDSAKTNNFLLQKHILTSAALETSLHKCSYESNQALASPFIPKQPVTFTASSSSFHMACFPSNDSIEFDLVPDSIEIPVDFDRLSFFPKGTSSMSVVSEASDAQETQFLPHSAFEYKLNDDMEPTPFCEQATLQVSPNSTKTFVAVGNPIASPSPSTAYVSDISDDDGDLNCVFDNANSSKRKIQSEDSLRSKRIKFSNTTVPKLPSPQVMPAKNKDTAEVQLKPHQEDRWDNFYLCLLDFKELHGHSHVPHTYAQDPALARWAKRQRYQYKLHIDGKPNTLTSDRLEKLESVGFIWDPQAIVWETRLQELAEYAKEYGDCNVPCRFAKNPQLGMWVKRQRRQYKLYKSGKFSRMSEDRFRILNDMGFVWEVRSEGGK